MVELVTLAVEEELELTVKKASKGPRDALVLLDLSVKMVPGVITDLQMSAVPDEEEGVGLLDWMDLQENMVLMGEWE